MLTTANRHPRTGLRWMASILVLMAVIAIQGEAWAHHRPDHPQGPPVSDPIEEPTEEPTQDPTDADPANSDITFNVEYYGHTGQLEDDYCVLGVYCEVSWSCDLTVATGARQLEILDEAQRSGCIESYVAVAIPTVWGNPWVVVECINELCAGAGTSNCVGVLLVCVPYVWPNFYGWNYERVTEDGQAIWVHCYCEVW